jgi:hypothetical protein
MVIALIIWAPASENDRAWSPWYAAASDGDIIPPTT